MKHPLTLVFVLFLLTQTVDAQKSDDSYKYFDINWKPAREKNAIYLLRIRFINDSCWQYSYYNMFGPLVRLETYQDKKATIRHGLFAWYNDEGKLDSCGYYDQGQPDKFWLHPSEKEQKTQYFDKGRVLTETEYRLKQKAEELDNPNFPDLSRPTPEAYFPGGNEGWQQYLSANLHYPDRAVKNIVRGQVVVFFAVMPTGKVQEAMIYRSVEMSLDDEAKRVVQNSPDWVPAIRFDRKVRAYKNMPIVFALEH